MRILKIFNNNSVAATSDDSQELILTGSGVGFKKRIGDLVDESRIEKTYIFQNEQKGRLLKSLEELPEVYFEITELIIRKAIVILNTDFDSSVFVSISDHISFAVKRKKEGVYLPNIVLDEIKILYKKEYTVGLWAIRCIKRKTGVSLDEDEAGYIALHLVNFSLTHHSNNATRIAALTKEVLEVIRISMKIELKKDSTEYARICIHLKYLAENIFNKKNTGLQDTTAGIRDALKENPQLTLCVNRILKLIYERYNYYLTPDEQTYLCIHIKRNMK